MINPEDSPVKPERLTKHVNINGIIFGVLSAILLWVPILLPGLEFIYFIALALALGPLFHKKNIINGRFTFTLFVSLGPLPMAIGLIQTLESTYIRIGIIILFIIWMSINYFLAKLIQMPDKSIFRLLLIAIVGFGEIFFADKVAPLGILFAHQMVSYQPSSWFIGLTRSVPSLLALVIIGCAGIFLYVNIAQNFIKNLSLKKKLYKIGIGITIPLTIILYGYIAAPLLEKKPTTPDRQLVLLQNNLPASESKLMENSDRVTDKILAQLATVVNELQKGALIFTNEVVVTNYLIQQDYRNYKKLTDFTRETESEFFWGTYYARKNDEGDFNVYAAIVLIGPEGLEDKSFHGVMFLRDKGRLKPKEGEPDSSFITAQDGTKFLITQCTDICKVYKGLTFFNTDYDILYASSNNSNTSQFGKFDVFSLLIKTFASFICAKDNKYGVVVFSRGKSYVFNHDGQPIIESNREKAQIILCNLKKQTCQLQ